MFLLRYGALCAASLWMSFLGAKKSHYFHQTRDEICRIIKELEHKCCMDEIRSSSAVRKKVNDLVMVKTKGATPAHKKTTKKRHCLNCSMTGHTKRNCPMVEGGRTHIHEDDVSPGSNSDDPVDASPAPNNEVNN